MEYHGFDPTDCGFPKPRVPVLPSLGKHSLGLGATRSFDLVYAHAETHFFTRGRYALTQAYRQAGVGRHGALLAPAYHCRTMLDPAIRLGAEILLYAMKPDLSPDMDALAASMATCQTPVKALLVTHYFGFAQDLEPLAAFCATHRISLIEDCAHALVNPAAANTPSKTAMMGKTGVLCVASPYKFFPSEDGGLLWANPGQKLPAEKPLSPTFTQELKAWVHALQNARPSKAALEIGALDADIVALTDKLSLAGRDVQSQATGVSAHYVAAEERHAGLAGSSWLMRRTNLERLTSQRRKNYRQWVDAVAHLPHCRAFFPQLPDSCVPYMFPLQIDHPELHFFALKQLGVPVWRWDDMAVSGCGVAANCRLNLLHLPCHQELSASQMAWLTSAVQKVMFLLPMKNQP